MRWHFNYQWESKPYGSFFTNLELVEGHIVSTKRSTSRLARLKLTKGLPVSGTIMKRNGISVNVLHIYYIVELSNNSALKKDSGILSLFDRGDSRASIRVVHLQILCKY